MYHTAPLGFKPLLPLARFLAGAGCAAKKTSAPITPSTAVPMAIHVLSILGAPHRRRVILRTSYQYTGTKPHYYSTVELSIY